MGSIRSVGLGLDQPGAVLACQALCPFGAASALGRGSPQIFNCPVRSRSEQSAQRVVCSGLWGARF
ncbi:hypothetical protein, partial [Desulfovibrio sp. 1214_IL3152]|uniref:hypothetical protein n=1 Tax=Desulfovibrio sp. 1214_IL3152 TaxID=3084056 RepID=UPI002FDAF0B4